MNYLWHPRRIYAAHKPLLLLSLLRILMSSPVAWLKNLCFGTKIQESPSPCHAVVAMHNRLCDWKYSCDAGCLHRRCHGISNLTLMVQWTFWASCPDCWLKVPHSHSHSAMGPLPGFIWWLKCPGLWSSPDELRDSIWSGWGMEEPATTSEPSISAQGGFSLSPDLHPNSRALRSNLFHFVLSEWFVFVSCWSSCCVLQNHLRLGCCFHTELLFKTWIWQRT